jgi:hypothetical protein
MGFCKIRNIASNQINLEKVSAHPERKKTKEKTQGFKGVILILQKPTSM